MTEKKEYIDREALVQRLAVSPLLSQMRASCYLKEGVLDIIQKFPAADVVEVVRCKDCKHFQPCFVLTGNGDRRPYTEEEIKNGKIVSGDIGINCASRCERFGYWEENKIPVWFSENDFCSYGERK